MAIDPTTLSAGGPLSRTRPLSVGRARTARRIVLDRLSRRFVAVGGIVVIAAICAILIVIVAQVYPLFRPAAVSLVGSFTPAGLAGEGPAPGLSVGLDEYREIGWEVTASGEIALASLARTPAPAPVLVAGLDGARVSAVAGLGRSHYAIGTSDGRVIPLDMAFDVAFEGGQRVVSPRPAFGPVSAIDAERRRPLLRLAAAAPAAGRVLVAQVGPGALIVQRTIERKALIGGSRAEESLQPLGLPEGVEATALAVDGRGEELLVGTRDGRVIRYGLGDPEGPREREATAVSDAAVTALAFLLGDRTLVAGDARGGVTTWQVVAPPSGGERRLTAVHRFAPHQGPVVSISASPRDKGFATADTSGAVHVSYGTSGQTLLSFRAEGPGLASVVFAPKADALLVADRQGGLTEWRLDNPHPEITLGTVFGKVWYEGYAKPEYVWQSTGGTDDFEAKFSLVPLIFGTLKGTLYALLFAVPLALLAALYVSEFMDPRVKAYVKPAVEIMAALPSVVLGFLAGLWLAPVVERLVPSLFFLPLVVSPAILGAYAAWRLLPRRAGGRFRTGSEVFLLIPVVLAGAWLAFALGGLVEATLLGGNYRGWLLSALGLTYDQRNSLVVGVAMGFAVIPIIFTIAEDSLANVPQHLRAGSLALGATRWQTALRIVLPTASPGIFSAVMIGFGRAVGETMIVLMATGNTPVMDWSIFNGFRALSANVAVELPEAPEGGTLFRVLFLASLLLFGLTFDVNTVAELVRLKLRARYRYL